MRKKKQQEGKGGSAIAGDPLSPRLTPADVQQKEFRLAFRGYNERDVDAFLDHVTEELGAYLEENRRLRDQVSAAEPSAQALPAEDAASQGEPPEEAEVLVARAREEAAVIVADARSQAERIVADASVATSGPQPDPSSAAPDPRATLAPFLSRERGFLQDLGRLVQGHAEDIRGMVQAARGSRVAEPGERPAGADGRPEADAASATPIAVPEAEPGDEPTEAERTTVGATGEPSQEDEGDPERQRSLRELFWGED